MLPTGMKQNCHRQKILITKIRIIMKSLKIIILLIAGMIILNIIIPFNLNAQSKARVENVDFFPDGSTLIITYDIVKFKSNETFKIWVDVYKESGEKIIPRALTGDVGDNIPGGEYKRIIWDMEADQAFLDEDIAVVVLAESETIKTGKKPEKEAKPPKEKQTVKKEGISVGAALGLSLVLPGLGRRVATGEGVAYLWGVAGYGLIGGALLMNNSAYNAYEDYQKATSTTERDDLYKKAKNYDVYSKVMIGGAAVIWVVDLILTGVKASKVRKSGADQRFSLNAGYDPYIQQPLVGVKYRF